MAKYPWDRWLNRRTAFELVRGRDFQCPTYSMSQQIRNAAANRGQRVSIKINGDTLTVLNRR